MIRDAGLMTSAADVCQRLQQPTPASKLAPTRVFIITCDRPTAVQRLLQSMVMGGNLSLGRSPYHDPGKRTRYARFQSNTSEQRSRCAAMF